MPKVDFSRYELIAVTQGQTPSGGYSIRVKRIGDDGRRLHVGIAEHVPGRTCVEPAVVLWPYDVVRIRRRAKPVAFTRHRTVDDC